MKRYAVAQIFPTIQGEGTLAGTPAVFVRLAGCNNWSGHEAARKKGAGACALWCDTDFLPRLRLSAEAIGKIADASLPGGDRRWAVVTGGEPALQFDRELFAALNRRGFRIALETNGSVALQFGPHHLTVSPKKLKGGDRQPLALKSATELKVVWAPEWSEDEILEVGREGNWETKLVQPCDSPASKDSVERCLDFVQRHPDWRLSVQYHKFLEVD